MPQLIVVMGVSGAGKTTIGRALAKALGWPFQDADPLHPRRNITRMATGHPLTDADRAPWLTILRHWIRSRLQGGATAVLACSLLRRRYRDRVIGADPRVALVYLHGSPALLASRMRARKDHFMRPGMLASQLATLEPPTSLEHTLQIEIAGTRIQTVDATLAALRGGRGIRYRYRPRSPGSPDPG